MVDDGGGDGLLVCRVASVAGAPQPQQPRVGNLGGERFSVLDREHRVRGAVDNQGRRGDRRQRSRREFAFGQQVVVAPGGEVARASDVALDQLTRVRLVEPALVSGEDAAVADEIVDDRRPLGPVNLGSGEEPPERIGGGRQVAVTGCGGARC